MVFYISCSSSDKSVKFADDFFPGVFFDNKFSARDKWDKSGSMFWRIDSLNASKRYKKLHRRDEHSEFIFSVDFNGSLFDDRKFLFECVPPFFGVVIKLLYLDLFKISLFLDLVRKRFLRNRNKNIRELQFKSQIP